MNPLIVHISEVDLSPESGMGRVGWHWRQAFERRGYEFLHLGPAQVGAVRHPSLFPQAADRAYQKLQRAASVLLVHEPASGAFVHSSVPVVVVSHGIERRGWELVLQSKGGVNPETIKWRTRLLFPLWRLRQCDRGLRRAELLLLINQEDAAYAEKFYQRDSKDIYVFKNGVYPTQLSASPAIDRPENLITILFLGSWIERKGIATLVNAAQILHQQGLAIKWLLAGVGVDDPGLILSDWPPEIHASVEIIPRFPLAMEADLFARSDIFVLPSFFEGQPLALLQAMAAGLCCITTDCCGQRDLIRSGTNGLLYEPGNVAQLVELIERCAIDRTLRLTLGENAERSVANRRWETVSAEIVDRVEALLR